LSRIRLKPQLSFAQFSERNIKRESQYMFWSKIIERAKLARLTTHCRAHSTVMGQCILGNFTSGTARLEFCVASTQRNAWRSLHKSYS